MIFAAILVYFARNKLITDSGHAGYAALAILEIVLELTLIHKALS